MDARIWKAAVLAAALAGLGANKRSANFIVTAPTAQQAQEIATAAEQYRRDLAIEWLGQEMPTWSQPCPITAQVADNLGAGGATSFLFEHGEVFGWRMTIQGSQERILDSVLPHEVTHTIFASHFRRPLPRWADEGACTTVEHASERAKQQNMLIDFLRTGRGIAFSRMFAMKDYPQDVMPLYSEGYSLARFLIAQGGKRKFLAFLADGMRDENWPRATNEHYKIANLAALQDTWLAWVRRGSPAIDPPLPNDSTQPAVQLADGSRRARPEPNLIYRAQSSDEPTSGEFRPGPARAIFASAQQGSGASEANQAPGSNWHAPESAVTQNGAAGLPAGQSADRVAAAESNLGQPPRAPQPTVKPRQIILEWTKPSGNEQPSNTAGATEPIASYSQPFGR